MKKNICFSIILAVCLSTSSCRSIDSLNTADLTEPMKDSLVYLEISYSSYELSQPWKRTSVVKESGYGCAVGPYEVLTTAANIADSTLVKARRYGDNAFISATVKVIDYEYNLCLLELDKSEMNAPLTALSFSEVFPEGKSLTAYWLSSGNRLTTSRCTLDRAEMRSSEISFTKNLTFFATNVSRPFGDGEVCCFNDKPVGLAYWGNDYDSGIIPTETVNTFLSHSRKEGYNGFGVPGFKIMNLLDPTMRSYLKMPDGLDAGVLVSSVNTIGTGSKELKQSDVIISIDGHRLNSYGRYEHPDYGRISFHHILSQAPAGKILHFEIFRDGESVNLDIVSSNVKSDNMLVPYYGYGEQPEFIVLAGFVFQELTRDYLQLWGGDWTGKVPPHLYNYYTNYSFRPTEDRKDIVILSFVLPTEINQGYQQLSRIVVDSVNGVKINSMKDVLDAVEKTGDSDNIVITFEMDNPAVVIPKASLNPANAQVAKMYGITKLMNIDP